MEALDYRSHGLLVQVGPDPHGRPRVEASASEGGINVTPALLLGDQRRIPWVLSEELAHRYLNETFGIANGGDFLDRLAQEGFAAWFQWTWIMSSGLFSLDEVVTQPILEYTPTPSLGHDLGKHAGAAHAGSSASAERLAAWLADPRTPDNLKACVQRTLDGIPSAGSPREVAQVVAAAHFEARTRGC
jgi:hypothetical protein